MKQVTLQTPEQARFELLEKVCIEGRAVFYIVGSALGEIKEREFWKINGSKTFDEYARSIGYSARHCNQMILDAEAVKSLPESLRKLVQSEKAARELAKLPEVLREAVLIDATDGGKKPATKAAIAKSSPPPRRPAAPAALPSSSSPPKRAKGERKAAVELPKDATGLEIPSELLPLWERGGEIQELLTFISAVRSKVKKSQEISDAIWVGVNFGSLTSSLNQAYEDLKVAKPHAVCPTCQGKIPKGCLACKGLGFVSEFYWNTCVPQEVKDMRGGE
jgi:hypothetical protein